MNLINCRIRPNLDETNTELYGWAEYLDADSGIFYNNVKVKIKKKPEGGVKLTLDFPSKSVNIGGVEKKIFYVKPVRAEAYRAFEQVTITAVRKHMEAKNEKANNL